MGSQSFSTKSSGRSAQAAYDSAVRRADDYYGHQEGYTGEINSSAGFTDVTEKWKRSGLTLDKFIEQRMNELTKFQGADCICLKKPVANTNKTKTQVQNLLTSGTKKWLTKFVVYTIDGIHNEYDTKGDAVKAARAYTEKYLSTTVVRVEKKLQEDDAAVAKITYKRSSNEKDGEYLFYGWASC